jgi:hypothetical protein
VEQLCYSLTDCTGADSDSWDTIRRDRDGYFLELSDSETATIEAVDSATAAVTHSASGITAELYGEITCAGVSSLFSAEPLQPIVARSSFTFVDLGSGTGKMVTQVAIDHVQCRRAVGVELSETRHRAGVAALAEGVDRGWITTDQRTRICLQHRNALDADTREATIVYLANYAFSDDLSQRIADRVLSVEAAPQLEAVLCLREFKSPERCSLFLSAKLTAHMSWSRGQDVFVYTRRRRH